MPLAEQTPALTAVTALVTLVAIDAVVDITRNVRMTEVSGVIASMTTRALKHRIVVRIGVAGCADVIRVTVTGGESRVLRMVERRPSPSSRIVAVLTGGGEELLLRRMARIGGAIVVALVAADTGSRQGRVIVVDVAICALARRHYVRPRQREGCGVVIERGVGPDRSAVTELARGGEAS